MVCPKCEKKYAKSSTLACTDVWRPTGSAGDRNSVRKVGENKLLSSKNRYTPYNAVAGSSKGGTSGAGKASVTFDKCVVCKSTCSRVGAKYCQACAYKKGLCAMCGTPVLDVSGYKQTSR